MLQLKWEKNNGNSTLDKADVRSGGWENEESLCCSIPGGPAADGEPLTGRQN